jgi:two-component system invasion response regulator UvrY
VIHAIRKVAGGGKYVSPSLADEMLYNPFPATTRPVHEVLSDREYQVLCLIASGKRVTDIAEELQVSVKTVSTYRVRILEKSGMKTNAELTRYAIQEKVVD